MEGLNYFTLQGEPNISYKFEQCNDGFGYFYFRNRSFSTTMTAIIEILAIKNIEFCEKKIFNFLFQVINMKDVNNLQ